MSTDVELVGTKARLSRHDLFPVHTVTGAKMRKPPARMTPKRCLLLIGLVVSVVILYLVLSGFFGTRPELAVGQPAAGPGNSQLLSGLLGRLNHSDVSGLGKEGLADGPDKENQEDKNQRERLLAHIRQKDKLIRQQANLLLQLHNKLHHMKHEGSHLHEEASRSETVTPQSDVDSLAQTLGESNFPEGMETDENQAENPVNPAQPNPVENPINPVGIQPNPVENPVNPVEIQPNPVENLFDPVEIPPNPVENPVEIQPNPAENPVNPVEIQPNPVENPVNPVEIQPNSVENLFDHVEIPPNPVENPLNPVEIQPNPPEPARLHPNPVELEPNSVMGRADSVQAAPQNQGWARGGRPESNANRVHEPRQAQKAAESQQGKDAQSVLDYWRQRIGHHGGGNKANQMDHRGLRPRIGPPRPDKAHPVDGPHDAASMFAAAGRRARQKMEELRRLRDGENIEQGRQQNEPPRQWAGQYRGKR